MVSRVDNPLQCVQVQTGLYPETEKTEQLHGSVRISLQWENLRRNKWILQDQALSVHIQVEPVPEKGLKSNTFTYRVRLKSIEEERDDYIQTYKVGKKMQELDELVARNIRRFSLTGIV